MPAGSAAVPSVLHLVAPAPIGGLERVVSALVGGLARRGRRVAVAGLGVDSVDGHPMLRALAADGVPVWRVDAPSRAYRGQVAAIADRRRDEGWAILHSHGYHADLVAAFVGGARATTFHGFTRGGAKNRLYEWLDRRAARNASAVVAVSAPIRAELAGSGVPTGRLHLIRNALPPDEALLPREIARRELGIGEGTMVGWVGRLTAEKGPDLFVEAIGRLVGPGISAVVIGDGPMRGSLEARARSLGVADRIRWLGAIPEAGRYYNAFDLLVLSSRTEGTPMVILEGMRAGIPIVATAVGGIPDLMGSDEAVLTPVDPAGIALGIEATVSDPEAAKRRAARAQARFGRDFDYGRWLDEYEDLYRSIGDL